MTTESKLDAQIVKLSDSNYRTWKTEIRWYLRGKGLLDHVLGKVKLEESATAAEKKAYKTNDDRAFSVIGLHVEPNQQVHIEDCENAIEAWNTLQQIHEPTSRVRIMQLKKEFYHTKMKEDETMTAYVSRVKISANKLKEAGSAVKDEDVAYTLLAGLPDTYENLNMTLANLPNDKFNSAEIKLVLLAEYDRRKSRNDSEAETTKEALHVNKGMRHSSKEQNKEHPAMDKSRSVICFNCKKPGHIAKDCRSRPHTKYKQNYSKQKRNWDAFLLSLNNVNIEDTWLLDSGCTHHVCKRRDWFHNFREINSEIVNTAAKSENQKYASLQAKGVGDITLHATVGNVEMGIVLQNVYYVPNIRRNLMSVSQIERKNKEFVIRDGKVRIRNKYTKRVICEAYRKDDLYIVNAEVALDNDTPIESYVTHVGDDDLWHRRFCHVSNHTLHKLLKTNGVRGLENNKMDTYTCDACCTSKSTKTASKALKGRQSNSICELIHSDVCGPMPEKSISGKRYFITFTDDFSRKTTVMCIQHKSEVIDCIKKYITRVERETNKKVKRFRTDNGLEYCNHELTSYFESIGIKHEKSNVESPQMNGVAERINRSLLDLVRSMLKSAQLQQKFWAEAVVTAGYIRNRVCHSTLKDEVPLTIWTGRTPSVKHLKVYGCLAYAHLPHQGRRKLDNRAAECILVGYANKTKGYRLWCPEKQDVIITKHVRFAEDKIGHEWIYHNTPQKFKYNNIWSDDESDREGDESPRSNQVIRKNIESLSNKCDSLQTQSEASQIEGPAQNTRRKKEIAGAKDAVQSLRKTKPKIIRNPYGRKGKPLVTEYEEKLNESSENESQEEQSDIEANLVEIIEPHSLEEALASPQADKWKRAINDEIKSLNERETWEVVDLPADRKCVGCKWVFKIKTNSNGEVVRYRARLVAQGFSQTKGLDYGETYAPVANFSVIRLLLALTVTFGWHTRHIDIKCAYLYGKLDEVLYMKLPELYKSEKGKVARLKRPIYGLKQSGRSWNTELSAFLEDHRFKRLWSSNCVYQGDDGTIIVVYVDDILIFSKEINSIEKLVDLITRRYEAHDLGEINNILGVKVGRNDRGSIVLSQKSYVEKILQKYGMEENRGAATPLEPGLKLTKEDCPKTLGEKMKMSEIPYREVVGSLMYLALYTRPDILYAVSKLSQYNENPGKIHWLQVKHVLRYLYSTKDYGLEYKKNEPTVIQIYCDADWANDVDNRHSYTGMVACISNNIVNWRSAKQKSISSSTMEAEYVALSVGTKEAMWMNMILKELHLWKYITHGCDMYTDNRAAIDFSKNRVEKTRTKHIDICYHIVREKLEENLFKLSYVPTKENIADVMTKALKKLNHKECLKRLALDVAKRGIDGN